MIALQTQKLYRQHLITPHSIVVVFDYGPPATILAGNDRFDDVKSLLEQGRFSEVPEAVDKALRIRRVTKGKFTVQNGSIVIDGNILPHGLSDRLLSMVEKGEDTGRLERFWDNMAQNPTESARNDLYDFLVANNVPITKDGCFIVYKRVRDNFWDSYTGNTFLCTPGAIVEMPRSEVDHDRTNTCSAGLHVAAWEYAHNFNGSRLTECKVNPRDVVAVPPDYNQQKMRVCRAEILRETTEKFTEESYDLDAADARLVDVEDNAVLAPDSEGRVRIPGRFIRAIGVGVGYQVEVVLENDGDDYLGIREVIPANQCDDEAYQPYTVGADNSIRVAPSVLEWAGLDGLTLNLSLKDGNLVLFA